MFLKHSKFKQKLILFFILPFILVKFINANQDTELKLSEISDIKQKTQPLKIIKDNKDDNEKQTSYLTTTERTILKSLVETLWTLLKEKNKNNNEYQMPLIDYYELGKIYSDLIIDELFTKQKNNFKQKIIELLVPPTVAFIIKNSKNKDQKQNYIKLTSDLFVKLLCKLTMVRWFQTPETTSFRIANDIAILGTFYKLDKNKKGIYKYLNIYNAAEKIPLDFLRTYLQSKKVDLGSFLNTKHRKKAIAKTVQVLCLPVIQHIINQITTLITIEN
ncbi:hypothetical protein KAT08_02615 [Candidatus Babeliales bacterium]|nr:hypothetical protein [Candidatus Babeliales bacterium]